jgi:hypothetical protein
VLEASEIQQRVFEHAQRAYYSASMGPRLPGYSVQDMACVLMDFTYEQLQDYGASQKSAGDRPDELGTVLFPQIPECLIAKAKSVYHRWLGNQITEECRQQVWENQASPRSYDVVKHLAEKQAPGFRASVTETEDGVFSIQLVRKR